MGPQQLLKLGLIWQLELEKHLNLNLMEEEKVCLKNKRAYLVITSGGTKLNSSEDFLTPWLKYMLNFFGIEKVDIICADQMALDYDKSIKDAEAQIENLFKD